MYIFTGFICLDLTQMIYNCIIGVNMSKKEMYEVLMAIDSYESIEPFEFTSCEGHKLVADSETINLLHHGNFGTTKEHYKNPNKNVILRDADGMLARVTEVNKTLDEAWLAYSEAMEKQLANQNS